MTFNASKPLEFSITSMNKKKYHSQARSRYIILYYHTIFHYQYTCYCYPITIYHYIIMIPKEIEDLARSDDVYDIHTVN